jgi:hypothetical protein
MGFVEELLSDAEVEVEVAGLAPFRLALKPDGGPPNPVLAALRPKVTVRKGATVLAVAAPYGEPRDGAPVALLAIAGGAIVAAVLLALAVRGALAE